MDRDDKRLRHFKSRAQQNTRHLQWNNCHYNFPRYSQNVCDVYEIDWNQPLSQIDDVRFRYLGTSPLQSVHVGSCLRKLESKCAASIYDEL